MEKSTKKKILIIGSILVIGGVVGFVLWKRKKEKDKKKKEEEEALLAQSTTTPSTTSSGGSTTTSSSYTFPFKSTDEGNKFRAWVNDKYPAYAKEISLDRTGGLNAYLQKAWDKYGAEYQGGPAGYDKAYVDSWNLAKTQGAKTFVYMGKTYDTATGRVTTVVPTGTAAIGKVAYPKGANSKIRSEARADDSAFGNTFVGLINSPNQIGKIKNSTKGADGYLWYEVDLTTPPQPKDGWGNPYAKVGWVREDVVTIKSA